MAEDQLRAFAYEITSVWPTIRETTSFNGHKRVSQYLSGLGVVK